MEVGGCGSGEEGGPSTVILRHRGVDARGDRARRLSVTIDFLFRFTVQLGWMAADRVCISGASERCPNVKL